ncbi:MULTISPECIES: cupin domain-containing protein [unclassified Crossiella]|uniref:cupin domain-containing protein n=1 Tax=unclassified Crossiella TaxID=2620835 RepID=UPI001FFFE109|nr:MULTISPECIES: cupin domain-containing protein [unclassified Crossiella]MCK2238679.1 cupin domain-containing protein [Crossiella sp. S99.2]MCK2251751.1 cupin domain-containing protein [Crossiella sp. S99.1]
MNRTYPGPTFSLGANTFHPVSTPSLGGRELAVCWLELGAGSAGEAHTVDREEVFVPVDGPLTATVDGVERVVPPGMALTIAPGELFALRNTAECPLSVLVCTSAGISTELNGQVFAPPWAQ